MALAASILLLCEILLPAPKISLIPSWRVLPRGNVTILCEAPTTEGLTFYLKKGHQTIASPRPGDKGLAHFPITNASSKDGGMYTCFYHNSSKSSSEYSEPLELLITDLELPKPNITLYPKKLIYLGSNVSIQCSFKVVTQHPIQRFYLHTDADKMKPHSVKPDGDTATFNIREVQEHHAGKYRCSYRAPSGDFISSKSSDDLELFIIGKGSDSLSPRQI
ncbi:osteoclast-associated immunoglobulin-like receptor [Podarcis muralis]